MTDHFEAERIPLMQALFRRDSLDLQSDKPVYQQILQLVRGLIQSGRLKPGDLLPSEHDLCQYFAVSRTTIRQAFDKLAENGLIIRQRGRGSFIGTPKLQRTLDHLYSFTDDMLQMGRQPSSKIVACLRQQADQNTAQALKLAEHADVFLLTRIRLADNEPILLESTAIPYYLCPGIEKIDFEHCSLYVVLQNQYGLKLARASESYEAGAIEADAARQLNCPDPAIGFRIRRIACLDNGLPFEFTNSIARGDRCIFTVELNAVKSQVHFNRNISV